MIINCFSTFFRYLIYCFCNTSAILQDELINERDLVKIEGFKSLLLRKPHLNQIKRTIVKFKDKHFFEVNYEKFAQNGKLNDKLIFKRSYLVSIP